jgi:hypothetical protein
MVMAATTATTATTAATTATTTTRGAPQLRLRLARGTTEQL